MVPFVHHFRSAEPFPCATHMPEQARITGSSATRARLPEPHDDVLILPIVGIGLPIDTIKT